MSQQLTLTEQYNLIKAEGKKLDMSRGKPSASQLGIAEALLKNLELKDCFSENGFDCRNYGELTGIPEIKRFFANLLGVGEDWLIIGGNSSLNMMYDLITKAFVKGIRGCKPWHKCHVKFLCPSPGYDRHFAVTEHFGIELVLVPMTANGPDMDLVEEYVRNPEVKGIWNVPKYSNPTGVTYSDETVKRFAALKPAAEDFCVIWDNAYCVHDLTDKPDNLLNIFEEAKKQGSQSMFYGFASTSKMTFAGGGVACAVACPENIKELVADMKVRTIGYDKINMLRHAKLLNTPGVLQDIMAKHRDILRDKFELCYKYFEKELSGITGVKWTHPNGGYFISLKTPEGCAKKVVELAKNAGLVVTPAGSGFPYNTDPDDCNIRIAPSYPDMTELEDALKLLCVCVKLAVGLQ